jgi:hypothetical protein
MNSAVTMAARLSTALLFLASIPIRGRVTSKQNTVQFTIRMIDLGDSKPIPGKEDQAIRREVFHFLCSETLLRESRWIIDLA